MPGGSAPDTKSDIACYPFRCRSMIIQGDSSIVCLLRPLLHPVPLPLNPERFAPHRLDAQLALHVLHLGHEMSSCFAMSRNVLSGTGPPANMSRRSVLARSPVPGDLKSDTARIASGAV